MICYDLDNTDVVIVKDWADLLQVLAGLLACCQAIDANTDEIETKLDAQITLLTSIDTELTDQGVTLDAILVDTTAIIAELVTLNAVDFATETTLAAILADTTAIIAQLTTLNGVDFATEATLNALLTAFSAEDFATETTLNAIKLQTDKLTFTGSDLNVNATVSFPAGAERPIELVEETSNGSTTSGVQSMSILFDGKDGTLDGVTVPDEYTASFAPNGVNDTIGAIPFTIPTNKGQRVLITYVKVS